MFAFFNLGAQEFLILLVIALLYGVPILLILGVVLFLVRRKGRRGDLDAISKLQSEVERLREDVDRLKRGDQHSTIVDLPLDK
jgi:hypothetical protein